MKVLAGDGGCWFCETKTKDMLFSYEFDTYVHEECVRKALEEGKPEAKIMAIELGIIGQTKMNYKSRIEIKIILIGLLIILAITNPRKDDYINWSKEQIIKKNSSGLGSIVAAFSPYLIEGTTTTNNYVFFSTFETSLGDKNLKVIGILNNYITFEE